MTKAEENLTVRRALALLAPLGPLHARPLFGGFGIYLDGVMFALVARDRLYFRVDEESKLRWASEGSEPFVYQGKGQPVEMPYWTAPPHAEDDPVSLEPWARLALEAARRARAAKAPRRAQPVHSR